MNWTSNNESFEVFDFDDEDDENDTKTFAEIDREISGFGDKVSFKISSPDNHEHHDDLGIWICTNDFKKLVPRGASVHVWRLKNQRRKKIYDKSPHLKTLFYEYGDDRRTITPSDLKKHFRKFA